MVKTQNNILMAQVKIYEIFTYDLTFVGDAVLRFLINCTDCVQSSKNDAI